MHDRDSEWRVGDRSEEHQPLDLTSLCLSRFVQSLYYFGVSEYSYQTVGNAIGIYTALVTAILYGNIAQKEVYYIVVRTWFKGPALMTRQGFVFWLSGNFAVWGLGECSSREARMKDYGSDCPCQSFASFCHWCCHSSSSDRVGNCCCHYHLAVLLLVPFPPQIHSRRATRRDEGRQAVLRGRQSGSWSTPSGHLASVVSMEARSLYWKCLGEGHLPHPWLGFPLHGWPGHLRFCRDDYCHVQSSSGYVLWLCNSLTGSAVSLFLRVCMTVSARSRGFREWI